MSDERSARPGDQEETAVQETAVQPPHQEPPTEPVRAVRPEPVAAAQEPSAAGEGVDGEGVPAESAPAGPDAPPDFQPLPPAPGYVLPHPKGENALLRALRRPWAHVLGAGLVGGLIGGAVMAGTVVVLDGGDDGGRPAQVSRSDDQGGFPGGGQGRLPWGGGDGQGGSWRLPGQDGSQQDGFQQDGTQQDGTTQQSVPQDPPPVGGDVQGDGQGA